MKKGFTLIELLAVIVILAIIALIATPIVLNIINDTKKSTLVRSADFYLNAVENEIMLQNMKTGGTFNPSECEITNSVIKCDENELKIKIDGEIPNRGTVTFENRKIIGVDLKYPSGIVTKNSKGELVLTEPKETLVNYIKNLYKETTTVTVNNIEYSLDETHALMNDRLGSNDIGNIEGNIRYYGANPNNYIDIGDRDSEGNIIFWRIIGVFKDIEVTDENDNIIKTEDLVKIIRADKLTYGEVNGFSWDYTSTGESDNNWKDSTLQVMLNNAYYRSGTTSYYNNSITPITLNFESSGLSTSSYTKVVKVNWRLGGRNTYTIYADKMYRDERTGTNKWSGKIALMYPSDYGYSADLSSCQSTLNKYDISSCISTNWMYDSTKHQWTLISNSLYQNYVFNVLSSGFVNGSYSAFNIRGVRPVLYLNSDVGIIEEKETNEGLKYLVVG